MALVSDENSTFAPLGANATFLGGFVTVSPYTAISVLVHSDRPSATNGLQIEWSTDNVNVDDRQSFNYAGTASGLGTVVHAMVRSKFARVRYVNTSSAQAFMRMQTLLHDKTLVGSVSPQGIGITQDYDASNVAASLHLPRVDLPSTLVQPRATGDPFLIVTQELNRSTISERTIVAASAFSQAIDLFGVFGGTRRWFTAYNDTVRGNLYIRLGSAASLSNFFWKVPPRHTWHLPLGWGDFSSSINGIWDVADGSVRTVEHF